MRGKKNREWYSTEGASRRRRIEKIFDHLDDAQPQTLFCRSLILRSQQNAKYLRIIEKVATLWTKKSATLENGVCPAINSATSCTTELWEGMH
jgi:hypothetical protein